MAPAEPTAVGTSPGSGVRSAGFAPSAATRDQPLLEVQLSVPVPPPRLRAADPPHFLERRVTGVILPVLQTGPPPDRSRALSEWSVNRPKTTRRMEAVI